MREIEYDETLKWMAGYNIYKTDKSIWRYIYGFSYDSDLRNMEVQISANAMTENIMLSLTVVATGLSLLF